MPFGFVEHAKKLYGGLIVNGHNNVRGPDVMDPRDVFVPDSLDPVPSESSVQKGRTLKGFRDGCPAIRETSAQEITRRQGPA